MNPPTSIIKEKSMDSKEYKEVQSSKTNDLLMIMEVFSISKEV